MSKRILTGIIALALSVSVAGAASAKHDLPPFPWVSGVTTYCNHEDNTMYYFFGSLYTYVWIDQDWDKGGPCVPAAPSEESGLTASIRGTAYEDLNANGKRDANEPEMGGAWYKVSNGGDWYVCGWVGWDATYSVPVLYPGTTYVVDAIAPVGWKTTTPRVKVVSRDAKSGAYLYNDLGFVRDPSVKTVEGCDQYHPVRR